MHDNARRLRLRLNVRVRFALIHAPRVSDGRDRGREHLKDGNQEQNPRESRVASEAHVDGEEAY